MSVHKNRTIQSWIDCNTMKYDGNMIGFSLTCVRGFIWRRSISIKCVANAQVCDCYIKRFLWTIRIIPWTPGREYRIFLPVNLPVHYINVNWDIKCKECYDVVRRGPIKYLRPNFEIRAGDITNKSLNLDKSDDGKDINNSEPDDKIFLCMSSHHEQSLRAHSWNKMKRKLKSFCLLVLR